MSERPPIDKQQKTEPTGTPDWPNDYRAFRSNPVIDVDPLGLQAATTQPTTTSQPSTQPTVVHTNAGDFTIDMIPFNHDTPRTGLLLGLKKDHRRGMAGTAKFSPNKDTCPKCKDLSIIQIVREYDSAQNRYITKPWATDDGWEFDVNAGKDGKPPKSPYYVDSYPSVYTGDGSNDGIAPEWLQIWDGAGQNFAGTFEFEDYVVCRDTGDVIACVKWGFKLAPGDHGLVTPTDPTGADTPSTNYNNAKKAFNKSQ